jgi:hypothetical protein
LIRWIALAVFLAVPLVGLWLPARAGRLVWTVAIAGLPLFIVLVGYYRWRVICPLAFFAQLPNYLGWPGTRKVTPWLEANYYLAAFAFFLFSLWLRLVATNGNGHAIAAFFVSIALPAAAFGAVYTGKTWCNYVCPVSFIEKIYTEPDSLRAAPNSQCAKCTACKRSCPDINEENGYWKEIESRPKRFIYFAYPGLVFGFYFYYYLQSGSWEYYFGGSWTNQPGIIRTAFLPGHDKATAGFFFFPGMPRALAPCLTLVLCALASYFAFSILEGIIRNRLRRREGEDDINAVRHQTLTIAAFSAFVIFYTFAGAPTLRLVPGATQLAAIVVVATATLALTRRLPRTPKAFAEESLAHNIVRRWPWADTKPPKDLHEAFLIHTIRSHETIEGYTRLLQVYKDAVRETLADGLVTRETVNILLSFRTRLQIKQPDHERVMAELAEEERVRINQFAREMSVEKRLQMSAYADALRKYIERVLAAGGVPNDGLINGLQVEYRVTKEEHAAVLLELSDDARGTPNCMVLAFLESEAAASKPGGSVAGVASARVGT